MIGYALIVVAILLLVAILVEPKIGAVLVWPIVFLYPHLYMQRLNLLPWNMGIDDLFICVFFLIVVVRSNILGRTRLRFGLAGIGVTTYFIIWTVANLSGWSMMPELLPVQIVKEILKCVIFVLFTYCLVHTIDTVRDLRRVVYVFVIVLTLAGMTAILHQLMPQYFIIFTSEKLEAQWWYGGVVTRAMGSLVNHNIGSVLLGMVFLFVTCMLRSQPVGIKKLVLFRRSWWMVRNAGEPYRTIASGVLWGLLAWGIGGLTLDTLYDPNSRYVYFFFAVLVERGFALARETQATHPRQQEAGAECDR